MFKNCVRRANDVFRANFYNKVSNFMKWGWIPPLMDPPGPQNETSFHWDNEEQIKKSACIWLHVGYLVNELNGNGTNSQMGPKTAWEKLYRPTMARNPWREPMARNPFWEKPACKLKGDLVTPLLKTPIPGHPPQTGSCSPQDAPPKVRGAGVGHLTRFFLAVEEHPISGYLGVPSTIKHREQKRCACERSVKRPDDTLSEEAMAHPKLLS